jgi:hypothetical protein
MGERARKLTVASVQQNQITASEGKVFQEIADVSDSIAINEQIRLTVSLPH